MIFVIHSLQSKVFQLDCNEAIREQIDSNFWENKPIAVEKKGPLNLIR